jgi:hypothetical protein
MSVEIRARAERSVEDAVARHLAAALADRGLLLTLDGLAAAHTEAVRIGAHLRDEVLHRCYPMVRRGGAALTFDGARTAARLDAALAFGAVTARVLAPHDVCDGTDVVCATFNLGIGLVDGLCDDDAESGVALLGLVPEAELAGAVEEERARGWLRGRLSPTLARNPTAVFTVDVIETFFDTLHTRHPGDRGLPRRRHVGVQLGAALAAEYRSVGAPHGAAREELIECSRLTSVLPFQIIDTLAGGGGSATATLIGEALWRIDDLVDLCQDARSGALNGLLLAAGGELPAATDETVIARAASDAADLLRAGLRGFDTGTQGGVPGSATLFRYFIQRYARIGPS